MRKHPVETDINKSKRNFEINFGGNFLIFVKSLLAWQLFVVFIFLFFNKHSGPIKHPIYASAYPKALAFKQVSWCLVGHLQNLKNELSCIVNFFNAGIYIHRSHDLIQ